MNSKTMGLSVIMAGFAVFFVLTSVQSIEDNAKTRFGTEITVLVARDDIKEMDTLVESMIESKVVPMNFVEPTAIRFNKKVKEDEADFQEEVKKLIGNVALVSIKKGEQLAWNKITEASIKTGLAPQVAPGKRAMSVMVDEISSVAKLLKPGDRVDLISVIDVGSSAGGRENKIAKTLLQDVVILAVGRNVTNNLARKLDFDPQNGKARVKSLLDYDGYSSITIEVDPNQAQLLAAIMAGNGNRLMFTLRNNDDVDRSALAPARATDALNEGVRLPASTPTGGK
ncbi:MAG: Flp pilus assembly protein CpaB [Bdellovibrionales bacterium]|nr:Flp pilus assembly protein CpaB [Bdellovibrionales bacterium]